MITRTIVVILGYLCVAGFVANGQYCNTTSCSGNQQCNKDYSFCNWGRCGCSAGLKFNTSTCVTPTVSIGGNCSIESDCIGTYTTCNSTKQCTCMSGFTVKSDNSDCTLPPPPTPAPKTSLNNTCTVSAIPTTCGGGARCISSNNTCQCFPGYTPVGGGNNVDCRQIAPNETCNNVTNCGSNTQSELGCTNANCNTGTYQCNFGYRWVTSNTLTFKSGCVLTNVSANVASGQPCAYDPVNNNYQLCGAGLTCVWCPENPIGTGTCQQVSTPTTTTSTQKPNSASNVQVNIMALAAALAFFRFAA